MKKQLSVLMLIARSTVYPILALLFVVGAAQLGVFLLTLSAAPGTAPEVVAAQSRIALIYGAGFLILCAILCSFGYEFSARQRYTLRRLRVGEKTVYAWHAAYCAASLLLYWAFGALMALALVKLSLSRCAEGDVTSQTLYLTFYRGGYLHSLAPLADWPRLVRNIIYVLGLALSFAYVPLIRARDGNNIGLAVTVAIVLLSFARGTGAYISDIFYGLLLGIRGVWCVASVCGDFADDKLEDKEARLENKNSQVS